MQRRRATRQLAEVDAEAKQQELRGLEENLGKSIRDHMPKSATRTCALEETHAGRFNTNALTQNVQLQHGTSSTLCNMGRERRLPSSNNSSPAIAFRDEVSCLQTIEDQSSADEPESRTAIFALVEPEPS